MTSLNMTIEPRICFVQYLFSIISSVLIKLVKYYYYALVCELLIRVGHRKGSIK